MKNSIVILSILTLSACATPNQNREDGDRTTAAELSDHKTVFGHTHSHGESCGHTAKVIGSDTIYLHNGEQHKPHAGHTDLIL